MGRWRERRRQEMMGGKREGVGGGERGGTGKAQRLLVLSFLANLSSRQSGVVAKTILS